MRTGRVDLATLTERASETQLQALRKGMICQAGNLFSPYKGHSARKSKIKGDIWDIEDPVLWKMPMTNLLLVIRHRG